jgi:peptidoglycan hydrolase-like protein with peptidoglycan-binding domain
MKKLILATASVLALGLAASGAGYAEQPGNTVQLPQSGQPAAAMPAAPSNATTAPQPMRAAAMPRVTRTQLRQVQQELKSAGLYKGRIDGLMGPQTRHAVAQFQQQNGLRQTGRLDRQTLAALLKSPSGGSAGSGMMSSPQPSNAGGSDNETGQPGGGPSQPAPSTQQ